MIHAALLFLCISSDTVSLETYVEDMAIMEYSLDVCTASLAASRAMLNNRSSLPPEPPINEETEPAESEGVPLWVPVAAGTVGLVLGALFGVWATGGG